MPRTKKHRAKSIGARDSTGASVVKSPAWAKAVKASADAERSRHYLQLLLAAPAIASDLRRASPEQARILCALFSGSQALSGWLVSHPESLGRLTPELLQHPRWEQGLRREVDRWLAPLLQARDYAVALSRLREFKQQEMLRIAVRDLARLANVREIIGELSSVADVCLAAVCRICEQQLIERHGQPYHQDAEGRWHPTAFAVLGLGKLGGQELNYSSDVDVICVYSEEGQVFQNPPAMPKSPQSERRAPALRGDKSRTLRPPSGKAASASAPSMSNHQFFKRLAEAFVGEISRMTEQGMLYRIDLRLRPEGDAGPLARSLTSYENYYAQWGQTWERMMLIKARCVAGDPALAAEFLETVQPFRYPRSLDKGVLQEIGAMKDRIEREVVKSGELDRNVKLGRGGIREIEFIAQTLQLINAGRVPFLQGSQTLPALDKLVQYELLDSGEAQALTKAYEFLRDTEHRLQMEDNLQTHTLPAGRDARERLAALMGFKNAQEFEAARAEHTRNVRRVYDHLLRAQAPEQREELPRDFAAGEAVWKQLLAEYSFRNVDQAFRRLNEFVHGPGYVHVSNRTTDLALQLLPKLFAMCPKVATSRCDVPARAPTGGTNGPPPRLSDPDRVLTRLDTFISAYGTRAMLFEMWARNPALFELLLLLFDRSEFLAETAIRSPDLVDGLVLGGRLRQRKSSAEILEDLRHGRNDPDQHVWLRRYHQVEQMRIGLRDILGMADAEQNLAELSALAEACLQYALEVVLRKNKIKRQPLVIIGLGKLGGAEINYGSDLDIIFVTDAAVKELPRLQRLAVEVMELLSARTELGMVFQTDARLRPDGEKGLLVNTLDAHENYYRHRAQLWEIQTLTRARLVAGNLELGRRFEEMAALLTDFRPENVAAGFAPEPKPAQTLRKRTTKAAAEVRKSGLSAYSPDWRGKIAHMRERIEKERTPTGKDALAIKTGRGGLMDAEFIAQTLCLAHGWQEANTLRALIRARDEGVLKQLEADSLIENYRQLRRIEGILRRWSFEGETVLPDEDAPFYRVAVRCGFATADEFGAALGKYREAIRSIYRDVMNDKNLSR